MKTRTKQTHRNVTGEVEHRGWISPGWIGSVDGAPACAPKTSWIAEPARETQTHVAEQNPTMQQLENTVLIQKRDINTFRSPGRKIPRCLLRRQFVISLKKIHAFPGPWTFSHRRKHFIQFASAAVSQTLVAERRDPAPLGARKPGSALPSKVHALQKCPPGKARSRFHFPVSSR